MFLFIRKIGLAMLFLLAAVPFAKGGRRVQKFYSSYRPLAFCNPSEYFRYPTTINEVVLIVKEAIARNLTVKVVGSRHSQTDIICTEGIPIDNVGLKSPMQINSDGTVTLGAGLSLFEATEFLKDHGRAFKTTPAFGNITLGGAIGTGAHGSSIKFTSSISSQVIKMTVVDGLGNIQEISSKEDLKSFRIHLGLLAVIVDITFVTHPLYKTLAHNYVVNDNVLVNGMAQKWAEETDQISLYWFPHFKQVVVANWTIVDVDTPGDAFTYDHVPSTYDYFNVAVSYAMEYIQNLTESPHELISSLGYSLLYALERFTMSTLFIQTPYFVPIYTEDGITLKNPAVGYYDRMFAPTCVEGGPGSLQCLWSHGKVNANITILDNEISLALDDMPDFISDIKDILQIAPAAFVMQGILMRFSAKSSTYMSTSYGRNTVHFEFYLLNRKDRYQKSVSGLAAIQTIMQMLTQRYGGRSHWGKSGLVYQSSDMMDLKLDRSARTNFVAAMNKFDPNGVFINNFGQRLKGAGRVQDIDPAVRHCALLDNCFCSVNSDCASYQRCTKLKGYGYPVCQTIGETPRDLYPNLPFSLHSLLPWLSTVLPNLLGIPVSPWQGMNLMDPLSLGRGLLN